ncbi:MAG: hypothetical protein ACJAXS_001223 [Colwellia sp.]
MFYWLYQYLILLDWARVNEDTGIMLYALISKGKITSFKYERKHKPVIDSGLRSIYRLNNGTLHEYTTIDAVK